MAARPHVGVISEIPTPYRLPLYERIVGRGDLDLEVLFCAAEEPDRPWDLGTSLERVPHRVLRGWSPTLRTRAYTFVYEINPQIVSVLRSADYDAIVVGGYSVFAEQAAIAYARVTRTPYLLHSESHHLKPRPRAVRAAKQVALAPVIGGAAAGLAVGSLSASYLESYGLDRGRIRILPNTIDVAQWRERALAIRADEAGVRAHHDLPERFHLYVGRLTEGKGVAELADARRTATELPPLLVAGEGPLANVLSETPGVRMLGFQQEEQLAELFALAEATIVPSRVETWGVAVNEALASGSPVIVSDAVGAAADLIEDGVNGVVFAAGDVAGLRAALERAPLPLEPGAGRIADWTYEFGVQQFHEAIDIALSKRGPR
ncbi:MAG TPA: glycosyltransferase family 4 protein [Microbacteriaceae bacterium]|jgi:glycosyltransferase involved in cell wall biosynthesis|nr:glycosyltransferase family 4 protein [Microbacteriaceae bacterium]